MKLGLLICSYGCPEYVEKCILPWVKAQERHDIVITWTHGMFKEMYELGHEDNDKETLNKLINGNWEDYGYIQNNYQYAKKEDYIYQTEAELRNYPLQYLLKQDVDYVILCDLDEFWTDKEIDNLIQFISSPENEFYCWMGINYKNYVLTEKQWIDGFCPPRIFKVNYGEYKIDSFYFDNDIVYKDNIGHKISYKYLPYKEISRNICHVAHKTWLNDERTKKKIFYQQKHFNGKCSYKLDKDGNVCIDYDFYLLNGLSLPVIYKDN